MLTRLKVNGFKNLVDVDLHFGPFTCIAGENGTGKSNLFDAIRFLGDLTERSLMESALAVRNEGRRAADIRNIFTRWGQDFATEMSFEAEMIVPAAGVDDLNQRAEATITFLRYQLRLGYQNDGGLEILKEELTHINLGDAKSNLPFQHGKKWRDSAVMGRRQTPYFISTDEEKSGRIIKLHQDGYSGRPRQFSTTGLPRTVLSATNALESPTALLAKREMQSWQLLQLEPSMLRRPDEFIAPSRLSTHGEYLASTLYRLGRMDERVYSQLAGRLSQLIHDVRSIGIDRDEKRELLTLYLTALDDTTYPAQVLSDGTLRFLALAVLEADSEAQGLLCLEEPENGIHPARITAMLQLLQDIAVDAEMPVGADNPLRQVIINTHSPVVVQEVPEDSLLFSELRETRDGHSRFKRAHFRGLTDTWRGGTRGDAISKNELLRYLNASIISQELPEFPARGRRVKDRADVRELGLPLEHE